MIPGTQMGRPLTDPLQGTCPRAASWMRSGRSLRSIARRWRSGSASSWTSPRGMGRPKLPPRPPHSPRGPARRRRSIPVAASKLPRPLHPSTSHPKRSVCHHHPHLLRMVPAQRRRSQLIWPTCLMSPLLLHTQRGDTEYHMMARCKALLRYARIFQMHRPIRTTCATVTQRCSSTAQSVPQRRCCGCSTARRSSGVSCRTMLGPSSLVFWRKALPEPCTS
mmetsp:Transcript_61258/g.101231  ORF Transcript_61258/g.101231 Transcript_61258/m.101231 type:complete len:221 (-) Transcript_61258:3066-3728(-)